MKSQLVLFHNPGQLLEVVQLPRPQPHTLLTLSSRERTPSVYHGVSRRVYPLPSEKDTPSARIDDSYHTCCVMLNAVLPGVRDVPFPFNCSIRLVV